MTPQFSSELDHLTKSETDWSHVAYLAQLHGVLGLLSQHIVNAPDETISSDRKELILDSQKRQHAYSIFLNSQYDLVCRALADASVECVHLKGISLDRQLFGGASLRPSGDMDVLIRKADVWSAKKALMDIGYEPELKGNQNVEAILLNRWKDYCFRHTMSRHRVEIHWSVVSREFTHSLNWDFFQESREYIEPCGSQVLGPNDYWLALAVHGCTHGFSRLKWIVDLAELSVQRKNDLDFPAILAAAQSKGVKKMILLAMRILNDVMGVEFDPKIMKESEAVSRTATSVVEYLNADAGARPISPELGFKLQLVDSVWRRIRFCWIHIFALNSLDVEDAALPRFLWPLYYLRRFKRLVSKHSAGSS